MARIPGENHTALLLQAQTSSSNSCRAKIMVHHFDYSETKPPKQNDNS